MAKYQKYTEYKDSAIKEIGVIPKHWDISKVKFLAKCLDGHRIPLNGTERGERSGTVPYWGANKIVDYVNDWIFDEELVLLGEDGAPFFDTTKDVAFAINGKIWPNNHVHVLRPNRLKVGIKYLTYSLNCTDYSLYISGSTRDKLNQSDMDNILIRMPSLIEQSQIANFLDHETAKIDSLITKQEKLIELLKEKRQAVISHAVTKGLNPDVTMKDSGVEWIGEVPKHWKVSKLKYESEVVDCRNKTPEYFDDGEYFVVRTTNVKNQELNFNGALYTDKKNFDIWTQRGAPPAGSILFTREAPTGQVCLVPDNLKFCMGQRMMNFISYDSHYGDYLFDYLISDCLDRYINSVSHGSTVTHLRVEQVENIPVLVPCKEEIKEIHLHILKIKQQFNALEQKALETIRLMQERRTALISSAVTGKIDVRNWQHPNEAKTELSL